MDKSLFELGGWSADDCILSMGCGAGWWEIHQIIQHPAREIILVDQNSDILNQLDIEATIAYFEKQMGHKIACPVRELVSDAESIPLENESIDQIWLLNALHEMENIPAVLQEVDRILKSGGSVLVEEILSGGIHEGCGKKLFQADELIKLFESIHLKLFHRGKKDQEAEYLKFVREA